MRYTMYCPQCDYEMEVEEKMSEHGSIEYQCPTCHTKMESKITGGCGFSLQGEGWASQGYKSHSRD